jgi:CubicO group peptidase (beta-lactamase class C family)
VVLYRGRVVGERYAPGVTPSTPLIGWSMTKSVTNAILGVLVRNGKLDIQKPAPIAEWSAPGDPRRSITPEILLRMVSGIGCGQSLETGSATLFDADTQMEYDMADQSAFAAHASLRAQPGTEWRYTNCNFVLLSRMHPRCSRGGREVFATIYRARTVRAAGRRARHHRIRQRRRPAWNDSSLGQRPRLGTLWPVVPS